MGNLCSPTLVYRVHYQWEAALTPPVPPGSQRALCAPLSMLPGLNFSGYATTGVHTPRCLVAAAHPHGMPPGAGSGRWDRNHAGPLPPHDPQQALHPAQCSAGHPARPQAP